MPAHAPKPYGKTYYSMSRWGRVPGTEKLSSIQ